MSGATIVSAEGVAVKALKDIHEPIDERLSRSSRPTNDELDQSLARQLSNLVHPQHEKGEQEKATIDSDDTFYIDFEDGDRRNPANFSRRRKWAITLMACTCTLFSSSAASAYNMGFPSMTRDLNCTKFQATIGLSVYALGFGIVPLVTASFSEEFGRQPLYIGSSFGFLLMYMMVALSKNIQTVIVARFLQGAFGSTGATMVGGTIADIWSSQDRGVPMSIFAVAALGGTGLGPVMAGWIEVNPRLEWRWIQWIQMIIFAAYFILLPVVLTETRTAILLTRIAKKIRKETGDKRYRARVEDERASLRNLIFISCTRPIHLMFTEPIVLSFSLWIGFAWGVTYCLITSISGVFKTLHGFNVGEIGTVFITMTIGSLMGFVCNMYQESLYRNSIAQRGPEARLHMACFAAILLPIGMFIFAWSSFSHVHWVVQAIGVTVYIWATFIIYLAVFSYLADCYGPFASSALAGQSLARNLMATAFPLFTDQMFRRLGYNWANTLFAFIALIMIPIPFVLFFYGPTVRRHSKFSRMVLEAAQTKK
ncbi:putative major facilitator superfamily protein [Lyophyllum shimeji]|uniref:Major facilitator superfamily protein n=1 Tax=Lyophyllum shimeji TaxID=47721 RepID=A0A9P3PX66_LYOSH|nr:putative major facilitator superfamily protein [Lyophyllum shimeji]